MRDYAHKHKYQPQRSGRNYFYWLILLIGILCLIIGAIMLAKNFSHQAAAKLPPTVTQPVIKRAPAIKMTAPKITTKTPPAAASDKTQFDFYNLLPHMKVDVVNAGQVDTNGTANPAASALYLQLASFVTNGQANDFQAELKSLGFACKVYVDDSAPRSKYNLVIGPLHTADEARQIAAELDRLHVSSMLTDQPCSQSNCTLDSD